MSKIKLFASVGIIAFAASSFICVGDLMDISANAATIFLLMANCIGIGISVALGWIA